MDLLQTERFVNHLTNCQPVLYAYIASLLGDRESARDVLQETNLVLWRKSAEFDDRQSFAAWASGIAHFQVLAWLRDRGREHRRFREGLMELMATETQEHLEDVDDRLEALRECLTKLPPEQRDIVRRRYEHGGSIGEIARLKKKSDTAISMILHRIRIALQNCIGRELAGEVRGK